MVSPDIRVIAGVSSKPRVFFLRRNYFTSECGSPPRPNIEVHFMNKLLSMLAASAFISVGSAAYACPDPAGGDANITVSERAYNLSIDVNGKIFAVDIGGSTPWSDCGISGAGFLPQKASIRLNLQAAEGKQLLVSVTKGCGATYMFVSAGEFRGSAIGDPTLENVAVSIPRSDIGDDQTIMIYLSADSAGEVCEGEIRFRTSGG